MTLTLSSISSYSVLIAARSFLYCVLSWGLTFINSLRVMVTGVLPTLLMTGDSTILLFFLFIESSFIEVSFAVMLLSFVLLPGRWISISGLFCTAGFFLIIFFSGGGVIGFFPY